MTHEPEGLADRFEEHRGHLRAVAYRMLGSLSEADDAVQETWMRLDRSGDHAVRDLTGWLTTVTARICLDMLRSRRSRREEPWGVHAPEPLVTSGEQVDPEHEALLADSVGLAMLVVLETLAPAERLAFVLHDMFSVPFGEIAAITGRTAPAARQLASRARRRVQEAAPSPDADVPRQREVVGAFLAAARSGDFDALVAVLDPEIVLRSDVGAPASGGPRRIVGAADVARQALLFRELATSAFPVLVNGCAGLVTTRGGRPVAVLGFTVVSGRVVALDVTADPHRLARLDLARLGPPGGAPPVGAGQAGARTLVGASG